MPLLLRYGELSGGEESARRAGRPGKGAAAAVADRRFRLGRNALRAEPAPCTDCQKRLFPLLHRLWPKKCFDLAGEYDIIYR